MATKAESPSNTTEPTTKQPSTTSPASTATATAAPASTTPLPAASSAPAAPAKPTWRQRLQRWLRGAAIDRFSGDPGVQTIRGWLESARVLASNERRSHLSVDDLFLAIDVDDDLEALLQQEGTSWDVLTDDVRTALAGVDPAAVRSGDVVLGAYRLSGIDAAAGGAWALLQHQSEGSAAVALFLSCLRPGVPSFARECFERRTGHTLHDLLWRRAHGDVVDRPPPTPRAFVVVYNDAFTPAELVVHLLRRYAHLTPADADALMRSIHSVGVAVVAEGPTADMAVIKAAIDDETKQQGHPLRVRLEPVVDGRG